MIPHYAHGPEELYWQMDAAGTPEVERSKKRNKGQRYGEGYGWRMRCPCGFQTPPSRSMEDVGRAWDEHCDVCGVQR
jgi:hypothetical protein